MERIFVVGKGDCDRFGLVRYRRYLDWVHETRAAFMQELGAGDDLLASKGIDMVTVNLDLHNLEACFERDEVIVTPTLDKAMDHAVHFTYTGKARRTGKTIFIAHIEMYPISAEGRLMRFPPEIADHLLNQIGA
ncbi:MAG TPA: acyl-CoA thioesterase [bacterium]|nr:acyl-CoA thioesterase [bacterium]